MRGGDGCGRGHSPSIVSFWPGWGAVSAARKGPVAPPPTQTSVRPQTHNAPSWREKAPLSARDALDRGRVPFDCESRLERLRFMVVERAYQYRCPRRRPPPPPRTIGFQPMELWAVLRPRSHAHVARAAASCRTKPRPQPSSVAVVAPSAGLVPLLLASRGAASPLLRERP